MDFISYHSMSSFLESLKVLPKNTKIYGSFIVAGSNSPKPTNLASSQFVYYKDSKRFQILLESAVGEEPLPTDTEKLNIYRSEVTFRSIEFRAMRSHIESLGYHIIPARVGDYVVASQDSEEVNKVFKGLLDDFKAAQEKTAALKAESSSAIPPLDEKDPLNLDEDIPQKVPDISDKEVIGDLVDTPILN